MTHLILASSSPYRKEMLSRLGVAFDTVSPDIDETPENNESPAALALRLSVAKAQTIASRCPGSIVIGSDQVATIDGAPLGKPGNLDRARAQLRLLSGRTAEFHSALCVHNGQRHEAADIITYCRFRDLSDAEIDAYLAYDRPFDTAGSAKAESLGIALMDSMRSDDPTAIIGLPLIALCKMLRNFGLDPIVAHAV